MQILKGKKDSHSEINQYVSEKETQVISIDKWASDAKAYKQAYEAGRSKNTEEEYSKARWDMVNEFINSYPPNFGVSVYPEAVTEEGFWNTEVLFLTSGMADRWYNLKFKMRTVILEWAKWDGIQDHLEIEDKAIEYFKSLANNKEGEIK